MNEADSRDWLRSQYRTTAVARLEEFVGLIGEENERQNLISPSTLATIWNRHIVDSAQLVALAPNEGDWVDIGSGGGLPGIVIAILRGAEITLVEPRRKRADFLATVIERLRLKNACVEQRTARALARPAARIVSARAVASADILFAEAAGFTDLHTLFIFPRGRSGVNDMAQAQQRWHGVFHVKPSVTDPEAGILTASGVKRR